MRIIKSFEQLTSLYGPPVPLSISKVSPILTKSYRAWIEQSCFCILSTVGEQGVHATPRGDNGPVVRVVDNATLWLPDWRGNNRIEALKDIVQDGRVALLFMAPGSTTTIRVNATAQLTDDPEICQQFAQKSRHPTTVILIHIQEVYSQCAKALMRSNLWNAEENPNLPTVGTIMAEMTEGREGGEEYDRHYEERSRERMW